jgi:hypothetical protein
MQKFVYVSVVVLGALLGGVGASFSQTPEITDLSLTNGVVTVTFVGGELQTSPTVTGPWTGTGNTNGQYSEAIGGGESNKFYRVLGQSQPALPGPASNPDPANGATSVAVSADLSWTTGSDATSHNVYFGDSSPGIFQGNQAGSTFDAGTLANNTTYFWRIDEANAGGTNTGTIWSFTTIVAAPGAAANPSPANSATGVAVSADLSWTAGSGATSHNVYFGTSSPGTYQGNQAGTTFDPGTLANNTTYYWRIEEVNAGGTNTGTVWSFTTIVAAPGAATNPSPANGTTGVAVSADLGWTAGSGATSHNVYFGTSSPGTYRGNQAGTTFDPGTLANSTTYYWRIDEVNAGGTNTGTVWSFTTEAGFPLVISNLSPPTNAVSSSTLAVGQLIYTDRAFTFTGVASLGGRTYIETANNDKYSTASSYLTFTVNQDVTVYVAHDDVITSKPSWLSSFTDTGENFTTSNGATYSLYRKDFNAGTVSLGGNAGGASSSMYSVVVVGKGTVTEGLSSDFYSDTWVAVDALGRALPDYAQCGAPRSNRPVALFYSLWHGEHGTGGPYDITKILAANPTSPAWGPGGVYPDGGAPHHWGEPEFGYYLSNDQWVMRKHAYMLANADIDVIVFDITNAYTYKNNYLALCSVFANIRANGGRTPKIAFIANAYADQAVTAVYNDLYSPGLYSDLWFYWKGKPLMLAPLNGQVVGGRTITYSSTILNFFNMRYSWAETAGYDIWNWIDDYPQDYGWHESSSVPEAVSVSAGRHANIGRGRSYHSGSQPAFNQYALTGTEHRGLMFAEQWSRLKQIDPELVFLTQWNEWTQQRFIVPTGQQFYFLGSLVGAGSTFFVDSYNQEFSRDIEPMKGGHTDNYYYQMIDGIRRYKGVRQLPSPSAAKTITIDGSFTEWVDVGPDYRDWVGDTVHRNALGWGSAGTYVNTSGRNDFVLAKVARDDTYVYFYIQTDVSITPYTDPNWMLLFINADQDYRTGWQGYDYVVNMGVNSASSTTLKGTGDGWNWTNVNANITYQVSGNKMEIRVPRSDIGQGSGTARVAFDFKWADNIQATNDIIQFAINGDSAPDRRFNYRYDTSPWTQLTYDDFEINFGNYTDGGANCSRYTGGNYAHQGIAAADIQSSGTPSASFYHTSGINVSAYSQLKVEFWYYAVSMEAGEGFYVEYWNGSSWQTIADYISGTHFNNGSFYQIGGADLVINNGTYTFPTDAKFRFRCHASDTGDDLYIDEVKISAR